jgi:hypothetical protein
MTDCEEIHIPTDYAADFVADPHGGSADFGSQI